MSLLKKKPLYTSALHTGLKPEKSAQFREAAALFASKTKIHGFFEVFCCTVFPVLANCGPPQN